MPAVARLPREQAVCRRSLVQIKPPQPIHIVCSQGLAPTGQALCIWVHYPEVIDSYSAHATCQSEEGLGFRGPLQKPPLDRNLLRLRIERSFFSRLPLLGAIELADGIRLNLPSLDRRGNLAPAFPELPLVSAAHEPTFDVDGVAFAQLRGGILAETVPSDDMMTLRLGMRFFICILPGLLSGQRKNSVLAVWRSDRAVPRVLTEITD